MKDSVYLPKGRKHWRISFHWQGKQVKINKAVDGTQLDTREKAEETLREIQLQISRRRFNLDNWRHWDKAEWQIRKLTSYFDSVGVCAVCGEKTKICQDHDHITGLIRGKLCRNCNTALGMVAEKKEILLGALKYLLFWEKQDPNRETYDGWKKLRNSHLTPERRPERI